MAEQDLAERLEVALHCPECGAEVVVGIWDQSASCAWCASLLVCSRVLGEEVFVVGNASSGALDPVELLIRYETESYRNTLIGQTRNADGLRLEIPGLVDARVAAFRAKLETELERLDAVEFLVPYELHERTLAQAVLGRRIAAKESFVRCFRTEDLRRRYDAKRLNLRDRGLKIRGSRLELLSETHREHANGRHLERVEPALERGPAALERSGFRIEAQTQVITQFDGVISERRLEIWKHMSVVRIRRAGAIEHYLVDRQFDTLAGKLSSGEARQYFELPERPLEAVVGKPGLRALASECPNCGAHLAISARAKIAFCATCALGIRVLPERLEPCAYALGEPPASSNADSVVGFPYWSLPFSLRAGGREFRRVWDWLETVAPQPAAEQFREHDPEQSRLFIPARAILGTRELDDAFAALTATATWRQPRVREQRAAPDAGLRLLDVQLGAEEAIGLARYALVALHDAQSTRSLTALNFRERISSAELAPGAATLVVLPLPLHGSSFVPCPAAAPGQLQRMSPGMRPVPLELLADDSDISRLALAFSLH